MKDSLIIIELREKIDRLQATVDTLERGKSLKEISYELYQKQDIITQVNEFYDSAWLKLIIVISILGILMPFIAQYFQRQNLKELTDFIRNQLNDTYDAKLNELKEYNNNLVARSLEKVSNNIVQIEKNSSNLQNEIEASTYYLQGRTSILSKEHTLAIPSFFKAAYHYLKTDKYDRANIMFVNLKLCLKAINNKGDLETVNGFLLSSSYKMSLEDMLLYFENNKYKESYQKSLDNIRLELKRINSL